MQKRTFSIGGATYDLFVRLPGTFGESADALTMPFGAKIRVEDILETCGGGACNTAVGLARLGCDAAFEGVVGSDQWGQKLIENLLKQNVNTDCVTVVEGEVSSFSIILSGGSGERVILYEPGTNAHLHKATFDKRMIESMDWVYFNHVQEESCVIQDDIVEMLKTDKTGLTWNPGGCQIDKGMEPKNTIDLLKYTNLLLLNKEEVLAFTKSETSEEAISCLLVAGVKNVVVTDGKRGSMASDGQYLYRCPVVEGTTIVDTTGAGDAFGTGATWALLNGFSLKEAMEAGSIQAASVVGAIGAQTGLLRDTEIRKRLTKTPLHVSVHPLS